MMPAHDALAPAGVQSHRIADLFWSFTGICTVVFVLVLGAFAIAILKKRGAPVESRLGVGTAFALTSVTLVVMLFLSTRTSRALASLGTEEAVPIEVIGHQWWWEFRYPGSVAGLQFTTAYEMHIPIGKPIEVKLQSVDVIHSFWVPSLHGKRDLIPGKNSTLVLEADTAGRYEGQCAEYCGTQHANMRFVIVAEPEAEFRAWLKHQLEPAAPPADEVAARGQKVFLENRCVACHTIGGTEAFATVGPNLTHFGSRSDIAMGTLPNRPGHLAGWIVDPQSAKPGTAMPGTTLPPDDLQALITYLGSLK
jgi:cytochrome c oxidase subunit 2